MLSEDLCAHATRLLQEAVDQGSAGDVQGVWKHLQQTVEICPVGFLNAISNEHDVAMMFLMMALLQNETMMELWVNLGNILKDKQDAVLNTDSRDWNTVWLL